VHNIDLNAATFVLPANWSEIY